MKNPSPHMPMLILHGIPLDLLAIAISIALSGVLPAAIAQPIPIPEPMEEQADSSSPIAPPMEPRRIAPEDIDFGRIEDLFGKARDGKQSDKNGRFVLDVLYDDFSKPSAYFETEYPPILKIQQLWQSKYPDSPVPLIVSARTNLKFAWEARGSGFASEVSAEAGKLFEERVIKAEELLSEALKKKVKDVEAYRLLVEVAKARGLSRATASDWVAKGRALQPDYFPLYEAMAQYLMPRWHGEPGDVEQFADETRLALGEKHGLLAYGHIACAVHPFDQRQIFWGNYDRGSLRQSAKALHEAYPDAHYLQNFAAMAAWATEDRATALSALKAIDGEVAPLVWGGPMLFKQFNEWCTAKLSPTDEAFRFWGAWGPVRSLKFAPNSKYALCTSGDPEAPLRLLNVETGSVRIALSGSDSTVWRFAFDAKKQWVSAPVNRGDTHGAVIWDINNPRQPALFPSEDSCQQVAFHPTQDMLAMCAGNKLYLVNPREERRPRVIDLPEGPVRHLAFSPSGKNLALLLLKHLVMMDVESGKIEYTLPTNTTPDPSSKNQCNELLGFDQDGHLLTISYLFERGTFIVRHKENGEVDAEVRRADLRTFCLSPRGDKLAFVEFKPPSDDTETLFVMSISNPIPMPCMEVFPALVTAMAFSDDGKRIAVGDQNGIVRVSEVP